MVEFLRGISNQVVEWVDVAFGLVAKSQPIGLARAAEAVNIKTLRGMKSQPLGEWPDWVR